MLVTYTYATHINVSNACVRIFIYQLECVHRQDGVRGLYSGVGAVVIGAIPGHAIHFATYEAVKDKLGGSHTSSGQGNSDWRHTAAGACTWPRVLASSSNVVPCFARCDKHTDGV